jgi:hypothetical protein
MIKLENSNLYLVGSGHDVNGNKIVKVCFPNATKFSIQTNGNLKKTGSILRGLKTQKDMATISKSDLAIISKEICAYIKEYGTSNQKSKLRC